MTTEEAIKGLKVLAKDFSGYKPNEEMFEMAIKALEKQIPKKPKKINHWRLCPNCYDDYLFGMKQQDYENISYCFGCGQAIDWEEKDEYS